uniref:TRF2/HOY1 PH-like domain-containing protein n=1 Tax=Tanacetum cinerariifolium TaxID=118510 RepID=A0A699HUR6_TANCI|nr:hypothetical protein [Tanacetum cinerariifolium]
MSSENNNVWQLPDPSPDFLTGDDAPMMVDRSPYDEPLAKRWKPLSSFSQTATGQQLIQNNNELPVQESHYNPLNAPSPLGLRLRKSPSLLELAQKRLNQSRGDKGELPVENVEGRAKRESKSRTRARASGSVDRLKASHFPALLLRIGQWEYVSKHEGDLVAKCYFSKHKIVWEVLDGGLKKKFEINWADIMALKANCAADGIGTLTIVLDKPPLYFKEVNPQPRKHTQWRATSDFTNGEANTHRQHILQCAQGVLDKHYEKLIQSDTRLNFLSQQHDFVLNSPYFPPKPSIRDYDISGTSGFTIPEMYIANMGSPSTLQISSSNILDSSSLGLIHQDMSKEAYSSSSGISMDIDGQKDTEQGMSISDLVNYVGNSFSEQNISGNLPYSGNSAAHNTATDVLDNISELLLGDSQVISASDERTLMSRVNSFCSLLGQQDGNMHPTPQNIIDHSTPDSFLMPQTMTQKDRFDSSTPSSSQMPPQDGNDNSTSETNGQESGIARNDSYSDLVHQLPRIASLPSFLFDISENGEILK